MVKVEVNGRTYNVREFMLWATYDRICDDEEHFGVRILLENLLDSDGNPYPDEEAMRAALPVPDVKPLRKEIYKINGLKGMVEDEVPLASENDSSAG